AQPDMSGRHWEFVSESLAELNRDLTALGTPLFIRVGDAIEILDDLASASDVAAIWSHEETGNGWTFQRDKRVSLWAKSKGIQFNEFPQGGVIRGLKNRDGWAKKWDGFMARPMAQPPALSPLDDAIEGSAAIPSVNDLHIKADPCPGRQKGGRSEGLRLLRSFLEERAEPYRRAMSGPVSGKKHCSRLSPHLAYGTLSMREVAQATWRRQRDLKSSPSVSGKWPGAMTSFNGRLHWRHHFMQKLEDAPHIEFRNMHRGMDGVRPDTPDPVRLAAFENGETGIPFVDACLRCLNETGWMNFRMRAMLQAFASYHLWLPWRVSGLVLARLFTDYEPGIHWSQVQMQSGTTGINTIRIYNPIKQGNDQDPDGSFTRRWLPELANVPDWAVQEPWKWEHVEKLGDRYPRPIVDPAAAAREAKDRIFAARKSTAFRRTADAIQQRHGSRRSGMRMTGSRPKASSKTQLELDL
ncbi:MAG: FAD-binding domain-containing protein, partial [Pseudomonadota bacterium]